MCAYNNDKHKNGMVKPSWTAIYGHNADFMAFPT
jgi:hypothetical protein